MGAKISMVDVYYVAKGSTEGSLHFLVAAEGEVGSCSDDFIEQCLGLHRKNVKLRLSEKRLKQMRKAVREWCFMNLGMHYDKFTDTFVVYDDNDKAVEVTTPNDFSPITCYKELTSVRNVMEVCEGEYYIQWTYGEVEDAV